MIQNTTLWKNEIDFILPQLPTKQKCGIITTLVSSFIGLTYEGIYSFLHSKRHQALHKAVQGMASKSVIQCNKLMQLENAMVMYGINNAETLEQLINIHNTTSSNDRLFAGQEISLSL